MKEILYSTAKDSTGKIVKASDVNKDNYTCLCCNSPLILKKGSKKRPHFAHKSLSTNCKPETVLHYSFKTLLAKRIQEHLDTKSPLEIEWECEYCEQLHQGDIIKKATQIKVEYNLKDCTPDLALLDSKNKVIAVIEVVVTHDIEPKVKDYYIRNKIAVVVYKLSSDVDINRLSEPKLKPSSVSLCKITPRCFQCNGFLTIDRKLLVIDASCWKCNQPMKVAAIWSDIGYDDSEFTSLDVEIANSNGCNLKIRYSKTVEDKYVANVCLKCNSFIGDHYLFIDYVCMPYPREEIITGYHCVNCDCHLNSKFEFRLFED